MPGIRYARFGGRMMLQLSMRGVRLLLEWRGGGRGDVYLDESGKGRGVFLCIHMDNIKPKKSDYHVS
jgi:hypothetical protein